MVDELDRLRLQVLEANDLTRWNVHEANTWVRYRSLRFSSLLLFLLIFVLVFLILVLSKEARVNERVAIAGPLPVFDASDRNRLLLALPVCQDLHAWQLVHCDTFLLLYLIAALLPKLSLKLLGEVLAITRPLEGVNCLAVRDG